MKTFRMIGMALVAMVLSFSVSSCSDDDDNFIEVDYSQDLVGTWTLLEPGLAVGMEIEADGSVIATTLVNDEYSEDVPGKIEVENNKVCLTLEDGTIFKGLLEIIPGETFVIDDKERGLRLTHHLCKQDLSKEILGMWVSVRNTSADPQENMIIDIFYEDGTCTTTGAIDILNGIGLNNKGAYKVIGDLLIFIIPEEQLLPGASQYVVSRLSYTPDATAYGDIMAFTGIRNVNGNVVEMSSPWLRVKQTLNLANQKYDYIKTYVTNVKGLDKDIPFMGYTFNFANMTSAGFDKFLKTILFAVEFPDANTIKYSCVVEGTPMSMECPIEVDGNKMTVKMSERYAAYRDIDFYTYQDKDDSQMHMYMPTYTFENFFSNIQVGVMAERGELDLNDDAAVEAVHKSIADAVETINVSFIMSKSK